jgi:hypothetical protein
MPVTKIPGNFLRNLVGLRLLLPMVIPTVVEDQVINSIPDERCRCLCDLDLQAHVTASLVDVPVPQIRGCT